MPHQATSCPTGDATLQGTEWAVDAVVGGGAEDADDYIVVVLSDANIGFYDVSPEALTAALTADQRVLACMVFIAEPGAAEWLRRELPFGRGHVCLEPKDLPQLMAELFKTAALRE